MKDNKASQSHPSIASGYANQGFAGFFQAR
jgi:hypothetical protein